VTARDVAVEYLCKLKEYTVLPHEQVHESMVNQKELFIMFHGLIIPPEYSL
jgi:hypothetical protein